MQLDLFQEEESFDCQESLDVIYCDKCSTDKPVGCFTDGRRNYLSSPRVYDRNEHPSVTGTMAHCDDCRASFREGLRVARLQAPPKPTADYPCDCCKAIISPKKIHLDHDHKTYMFRGWLCRKCNTSIGGLGDTIEGLNTALVYLRKHYER